MRRATALPITIVSLPRYVSEVMARAAGLASRRVSSASHTASANPPSSSRPTNTYRPSSHSQTSAARSTNSERRNSSISNEPPSKAARPAASLPVSSVPRSAASTSLVSPTPVTRAPVQAPRNVSVVPQSSNSTSANPPPSNAPMVSMLPRSLNDTLPNVPAPRAILAASSRPATDTSGPQNVPQARLHSKRPASLSSTSIPQSPASRPSVAKRSRVSAPKAVNISTANDVASVRPSSSRNSDAIDGLYSESEDDDMGFWDPTGNVMPSNDAASIAGAMPAVTLLPIPRTSEAPVLSPPVPVLMSGTDQSTSPKASGLTYDLPLPRMPLTTTIPSPLAVVRPSLGNTGPAPTDMPKSESCTQSLSPAESDQWTDTDEEDMGFWDTTGNVVPLKDTATAPTPLPAENCRPMPRTSETPIHSSLVTVTLPTSNQSASPKASGPTAGLHLPLVSPTPSTRPPQEVMQPLLTNAVPLSIVIPRREIAAEVTPLHLRVRIPAPSTTSTPESVGMSSAPSSGSTTSSSVIASGLELSGPSSASSDPRTPVEEAADNEVRVFGVEGIHDSNGSQRRPPRCPCCTGLCWKRGMDEKEAGDDLVDNAVLEAALILASLAGAAAKPRN